jgi:hypothetical protein
LRAEAVRKAKENTDRPDVYVELSSSVVEFYGAAFARLSTERMVSNGYLMAIPWSSLYAYGRTHGLSGPALDHFVDTISAMDAIDRRRIDRETDAASRNRRFVEKVRKR